MSTALTVDVFLRKAVPEAARTAQMEVLGRLRDLEAAGVLDDVTVTTWDHRARSGDAGGAAALAAYDRLTEWARAHDASLRPGFDAHPVRNAFTGSDYTTTVLPVICLAVSEDGRLVDVYPRTRGARTESVGLGLDQLESAGLQEPSRRPVRP